MNQPTPSHPIKPAFRAGVSDGVTFALHVVLAVLSAAALVPFFWMVCACFKRGSDIFAVPFLPWHRLHDLTLDNFRLLLATQPVGRWIVNSLFVSSVYTVLVVLLSSLGGFALAKYQFVGKRPLMLLMLATMLVPGQVLLPGNYEVMLRLGWINSWAALIVPGAVSVFGLFLFRQAMLGVPDELLHAGRIDGCSELRLWWNIALPITRPAVGAFTLLSFLAAWNSYLWPQIILQDRMRYTLPVGLAGLMGQGQYESQYGVLMAGTLLATIPAAIVFFMLERQLVSGLTSGAISGS
jgi:ABC-type glycerol-3-phosphate transport system permease component